METLRLALEAIAKYDPEWLTAHTPAEWRCTYGSWTQGERLVRETGKVYLDMTEYWQWKEAREKGTLITS